MWRVVKIAAGGLGILSLVTGASLFSVADSVAPSWRERISNPAFAAWALVLVGLGLIAAVTVPPLYRTYRPSTNERLKRLIKRGREIAKNGSHQNAELMYPNLAIEQMWWRHDVYELLEAELNEHCSEFELLLADHGIQNVRDMRVVPGGPGPWEIYGQMTREVKFVSDRLHERQN
jgi:hypothetical protein